MRLSAIALSYPTHTPSATPLVQGPGIAHNVRMTLARGIAENEYYHVYNRGAQKLTIFKESSDWIRFIFLALYMQSPHQIPNALRYARKDSIGEGFPVPLKDLELILNTRMVELVGFCLMPNHFHLIVLEKDKDGIARYMQRVNTGYTMYFNKKYKTSGHVFQGRYQTVRVDSDEQLMHLSAYIHRNPRELKAWRGKEEQYPYSSLQDYIDKNRWGNLISTDIIAGRFENTPKSNYRDFVRTSPAKSKFSDP